MMLYYYCLCQFKGGNSLSNLKLYSQYLAQRSIEMLNSILEQIYVHNLIPKILLLQSKHFSSIQNLNCQYELLSFIISHFRQRDLVILVYFP